MTLEVLPERSRNRNPLLLPVRFLFYWVIKALVLLFLGIRFLLRPRLVRYGLLMLLVAGGIAWKAVGASTLLPWSAGSTEREFASTVVSAQMEQPAVVERYFKAQSEYDANGMWETMADRLKQRMMMSNNSPQQLQKNLDSSRDQGRRYSDVAYVGGVALGGGRNAFFYVLTVEGPSGTSKLPYTFVVDPDGKIGNIQWSME